MGNVGYSQTTTKSYTFQNDTNCIYADNSSPVVEAGSQKCSFLGRTFNANVKYCGQLTSCVEKKLQERFKVEGYVEGDIPIWNFPSGNQAIKADLGCTKGSTPGSLHNPGNGCRAIDFNVHENSGNLLSGYVNNPQVSMPPEFVAIMEECDIIWGGRYTTAEGQQGGCDPMEFIYAPSCIK